MTAPKLIGLAAAAAHHAANARNPDDLADAHDALDEAFYGLDADEAHALGKAAGVLLEQHARQTGDWNPWAQIWWNARRPALWEAGAGFRARLDKAANAKSEWEIRGRRLAVERAEAGVRRAVRPLLHQRASKAQVEEAAGRAAGETIEWPRIFAILVEEFDQVAQVAGVAHG